MFRSKWITAAILACTSLGAAGCSSKASQNCSDCDVVVVAAVGEPSSLLPPVVDKSVGRDISDLLFERLAVMAPGAAPLDTAGYRPGLATSWSRVDPLTWQFVLRDGARWSDGQPVTASDVAFSFDVYADSVIDAVPRRYVQGRMTASAVDARTVRVAFKEPAPEQLFDATQHVRVLPKHIWEGVPRASWVSDTSTARLIGSGPYKLVEWKRGEFVRLVADSARAGAPRPVLTRAVWRFVADPDAGLNLVLSHDADLLESVGSPARVQKVEADSSLRGVRYPSAVYGFLAFQLAGGAGQNPALKDRRVRNALGIAADRAAMAVGLFGAGTRVPDGPISQVIWLSDSLHPQPVRDSIKAAAMLDAAGWTLGADGLRHQGGHALGFDILVPSSSTGRRDLAQALQAEWKALGLAVTITSVDFPVFQQRLQAGKFDSYIGAYLDEPTPRGLGDQWGSAGIGSLNYGKYKNPAFDALLEKAAHAAGPSARGAWREALDTLVADAPALFLYAPVNVAAVSRRMQGVVIDPWSWLSGLPTWSKQPAR